MKKLSVLVKPTNDCNLRCTYCYNAEYEYSKAIMNVEVVEEIIAKTVGQYDYLHLIWHGGEPLLAGLPFYKKALEIEQKFKGEIEITNSIQTNGTLLDEATVGLLVNNHFSIGISYDGVTNEQNRGSTAATERGIALVKDEKGSASIIKVMLKEDMQDMRSLYERFKKKRLNIKLNPVFSCELVEQSELCDPQEFATAMKELFDMWVDDESCNIRIATLENYMAMAYGYAKKDCNHSSCLTRFLSVDPNGDIYPCSRYYPEEFCLGNLSEMDNITDCFKSTAFERLIKGAISRREKCKQTCDLFLYCQGGCNHSAISETGLENNGFFACTLFKEIFPYIKERACQVPQSEIKNPKLRSVLDKLIRNED